jgi:aminoglycoside phosphotransferase family enzyme/predicted kinase
MAAPPDTEKHRGPFAAVHETHIGVVFLVGDRAYKIKKPVRTGFLDFSTPSARRLACDREVELNRRLAPDVYLGLSEVTDPLGGPSEPAVVMRRMPVERRLSSLVERGVEVNDALRALARRLAAFHAAAERRPDIDADAGRDALADRWRRNLDEVVELPGELDPALVTHIDRLVARFLAGRGPLFATRIRTGRVVDGHGDLLADDIFCLPDGPRALDCIEFDDRLRHVDGLDDACFLAMDLERLGSPELGRWFLACYADFAGDPAPGSLRHHYIAYRAFVRAKVACLRHGQGDQAAGAQAAELAALSLRHLERAAVRLVLIGGLPGTGKSTLAGALADRVHATLLSSDRVRKELAGLDPDAPAPAGYREALYAPEVTDRVYTELHTRAAALLQLGECVVLDASWSADRHRQAAEATARACSAEVVSLRCVAPAAVAADRMRRRGPTASDADAAVATRMARDADPWPAATVVPTDVPLRSSQAAVEAAWHAVGTARQWP